jgi:hypothetical protein
MKFIAMDFIIDYFFEIDTNILLANSEKIMTIIIIYEKIIDNIFFHTKIIHIFVKQSFVLRNRLSKRDLLIYQPFKN